MSSPSTSLRARNGYNLPFDIEIEWAVLNAMMRNVPSMVDMLDILSEDSFYEPTHRIVFSIIKDLFSKNNPTDVIAVVFEFKKKYPKEFVINKFIDPDAHYVNIDKLHYYAYVLAEMHIRRKIIQNSEVHQTLAFDSSTDTFDVLSKVEDEISGISQIYSKKKVESSKGLTIQALDEIEAAMKIGKDITGVPTGFKEIDSLTSGWQKSDLIVLAARPSMGKTAFALAIARNAAVDYQIPVAVFSLEMSSVQLVKRLFSVESEISSRKITTGQLNAAELLQIQHKVSKIHDAPIFVDDTSGLSCSDLRSKAIKLKNNHQIGLIVVDYLQLMHAVSAGSGSGNREQEISTITRNLKELAKELNVPVIALSQLSRNVESRGDKRPQLSDLRESGAIEQDADIVAFLYRPEYYGIIQDENGESTLGLAQLIFAKHRNGALNTCNMKYIAPFTKFIDIKNDIPQTGPDLNFFNNINPNLEF